jgi:alpha-beta hydrolase superfamily lysophospholipase
MLKVLLAVGISLFAQSAFAVVPLVPFVGAPKPKPVPCPSEWKNNSGKAGCAVEKVIGWHFAATEPKVSDVVDPFTFPGVRLQGPATVRHGYIEANPSVAFKGNVVYLEGIADSMLNHTQLFKAVTDAGYRMIAWDLDGQGGSKGKWGSRLLLDMLNVANQVYKRDMDPRGGLKVLMGWSIGGINGYAAAAGYPGINPDAVILNAPSIDPLLFGVGEGFDHLPPGEFTPQVLTTALPPVDCGYGTPFVEPILGFTPASSASFTADILELAFYDRHVTIPGKVKGLVLMTGPKDDTYAKGKKHEQMDYDTFIDVPNTEKVFREKAPHFRVVEYPRTKHMVDAESCAVRNSIAREVGDFLGSL